MKKFIALMLSVMLLIGCIGSAEISSVKADATYMGQQVVDALFKAGTDEDGCQTATVQANLMGQVLAIIAQVNDKALTISDGENSYTITAEAATAAATILAQTFSAAQAETANNSHMAAFGQYAALLSGLNWEDYAILSLVAISEVNRIAQIASSMGFVTMTETGDIIISVDATSLLSLAGNYLTSLAADENIIPSLAQNHLWAQLGLPEAAVASEYLNQIAAFVLSIDPVQFGMDAALYIEVLASGSVYGTFSAVKGEDTVAMTFNYDGTAFAFSINAIDDGMVIDYTYSFDGTTFTMVEKVGDEAALNCIVTENEDGTVAIYYAIAVNGMMNVAIDAVVDPASLSFTANVDYNGMVFNVVGYPAVYENGMGYKVDLTIGETVINYEIGYTIGATEEGTIIYGVYVNMGEESYVATVEVAGYNAMLTVYHNEDVMMTVAGGLYLTDETTANWYVTINGITYILSINETAEDGVVTVNAALTCTVEDQSAEIGTLTVVLASEEGSFSHISGYELSAEEVMSMVAMIAQYAQAMMAA